MLKLIVEESFEELGNHANPFEVRMFLVIREI